MQSTHQHLCQEDRQCISELRQQGKNQTEIAKAIGRSQSTISKEISRNSGKRGYHYKQANEIAEQRKVDKTPRGKVINGKVKTRVDELFELSMTPEMIAMQMANENTPVSHQTVYEYVKDDRLEGGDLYKKMRKNKWKKKRKKPSKGGQISDRVGIEERPTIIDNRGRYGDWEADLIDGKNGFILSLYERKSRFAIITKMLDKKATTTSEAIIEQLNDYKVNSITYDNGLEFAHHKTVSEALNCKAYFCAPYHSWEKGGVENFNRNVRFFLPKGTRIGDISEDEIEEIQNTINQWPKKVINRKAPIHYEIRIKQ